MKINQSLELKLKTSLNLLLKQQVEVLSLPVQELERIINEEAISNPFVKGIFRKIPKRFYTSEEFTYEVPYEPKEIEVLEENVRIEFKGREREIALELLRFIDEKGFLREDINKIAGELGISPQSLEEIRRKLMRLEPLGVCSRDVWEFLEIQIEEVYPEEAKELKKALSQFRETGRIQEKVKEKLSRLRLSPLVPQGENVRLYKVDAIIEEEDGELRYYLYEEFIDIDLNEEYWEIYRSSKGKVKGYLREAFERYEAIKKALEIRKRNLREILGIIVQKQEGFLKGGDTLKTLTIREVSERLGVHESTVSRIVNSKYVKTPVGTYPLRFFFVRESVEGTSQEEILTLIKEIIEKEDKSKPLSDEEIAKILQSRGVNVARRTVTKYREILGIPSSRKRRKI
ncbi:RNA polymerase factor sigma-54 [Aquifex pyrophilus]